MQMNVVTSALIALAILLGSTIVALGGRYQVASGDSAGAWRVDRLTGEVKHCRFTTRELTVQRDWTGDVSCE